MAEQNLRQDMKSDDLQVLIAREIETALGGEGSLLSAERAENARYYLGEKFGNEQEGRSQVISTDVADTIEWMLPHLIRIFASGENTVSFEPVGLEDIPIADQATQFVNHIWNQDNEGFINFYTWFKDALISKNGFIKIWWDDAISYVREEYQGFNREERLFLLADPDVEVVSEHVVEGEDELGLEVEKYDLVVKRAKPNGRVKIDPVPPEEFLISAEAKTLEEARFVAHRQRRTLSSLRAEGFSKSLVEDLSRMQSGSIGEGEEARVRDTVGAILSGSQSLSNQAMQEIWVTECYIRIDLDGDGIAEQRQITVAGPEARILRNVPWEGPVPFSSLTPVIMPHQFYGRAIADLVKDIQLIKSTILRQYLDGLYLANNPRQEAVEANIVEPSELLTSRPGGIVRVKERGSINPIAVPYIGDHALKGLHFVDQMRENRSGISPRTQGLSDNPLHQTASGQRMLFNAAQGKLEIIARIFAETGVKRAFRIILDLVSRHQQKERVIRLRNQWVPMDPQTWSKNMDVRISVGLGFGDKDTQLASALKLLELQKQALEYGYASPANMLETAEIIVNAMGFKGAERFFSVPTVPGVPQGASGPSNSYQSDADRLAAQQAALLQNQEAIKQAELVRELQAKAAKFGQDRQLKEIELQHKFEVDRLKLENEIALKREEAAQEMVMKREEAAFDLALKKEQLSIQK
jgi:hypothetical protein